MSRDGARVNRHGARASRSALLLLAGAVLLLSTGSAHAHLVTTGMGPVYDGVSHLFLTFDDLLPVLAAAALAGLCGPAAGRRMVFVLPVAWVAGGLAGYGSGLALFPRGTSAVSLLLLGVLVAASPALPPRLHAALALALGLVHGWMNGASFAAAGSPASSLAGVGGAIFVLAALASAGVVALRPPWTRIAVRAAGSWIAAIGLLYLGWVLSGRA